MRFRSSEVGKTVEGGKITGREELKSKTRPIWAQFQNKADNETTPKTGIMTTRIICNKNVEEKTLQHDGRNTRLYVI